MDGQIAQYVVNALVLGSIYSLVALGFSLLFGVLNVIHFSHGDVAIVAPFTALLAIHFLTSGALALGSAEALVLALVAAVLLTGIVGILLDVLVIRRFRAAPAMMALVATVALGSVVRELIRMFYPQGSNPKPFPTLVEGRFDIGGVTVSAFSALVVVVSFTMVALLFFILHRTPVGVRIRAVAEDRDMARVLSIRTDRIFAATFFLASATGAIGGLFFASHAGVVRFDFGVQLGLIGFSAAVIGGLGSMQGAILGSVLIAGIDAAVQALVPDGASYRLVFIFVLVIAVLVLRPAGLLGRPVFEKV
jgi:branched-chain amino acid transport system permease protein